MRTDREGWLEFHLAVRRFRRDGLDVGGAPREKALMVWFDYLAIVLAAVLLVALIVVKALSMRGETRRARRLVSDWEELARHHGAELQREGGHLLVEADVEGRPIRLYVKTVDSDHGRSATTRLRTAAPYAADLDLRVSPQRLLSQVGTALGAQDMSTGDDDFDHGYVVKTNDVELARAWLGDEERSVIASLSDYELRISKGWLSVWRWKIECDMVLLEAALQATAMLAGRGERMMDQWAEIAQQERGAFHEDERGGYRIEIEERSVPMWIELFAPSEHHGRITRVVARVVSSEVERYELAPMDQEVPSGLDPVSSVDAALPSSHRLVSSDPLQTGRRFRAEISHLLERAAPLRIRCGGREVAIELAGLVPNAHQVEAALELALTLAGASATGPYR